MDVLHQRGGRLPDEVVCIIDTAFDGGECAALSGQLDAGPHAVIAHEFHHLRGELQALLAAVAYAAVIHQVAQSHDAQSNPAGIMRGFRKLRHSRDVSVGFDDIIQEDCRRDNTSSQRFPIHGAVRSAMLSQVDGTQAAVLVGTQPLFTAGIGGFQRVKVRHGVGAVGGIQEKHARFAVVVCLPDDLLEQIAGMDGFEGLHGQTGFAGFLDRSRYISYNPVRQHPGKPDPNRRPLRLPS